MHLLGGKWKFYNWERMEFLNLENKHFKTFGYYFHRKLFLNYLGANKSSKLIFMLLNQLFESFVKRPLVL